MRFPHRALGELRAFLEQADPQVVTSSDAARLVRAFAEVERVGAAGKVLFSRRASESRVWAEQGHRTFASWLSEVQKSSLGEAVGTLETSKRLEGLDKTTDALRTGKISTAQAAQITVGAAADPSKERELIGSAARQTFKGLRNHVRQVSARAGSAAAELERYDILRRRRYLRWYTEADGAFCLDARLTPDAGARVASAVEAEATKIFDLHRKEGTWESSGAYRADALVSIFGKDRRTTNHEASSLGSRSSDASTASESRRCGRSGSGRNTVVVRVDAASLRRGFVEGAELCEIAGVGPVPVATARSLLPEAFVKVVVRDSVDVRSVCHIGRTVSAHIQSALDERDPTCVVPGCDMAYGLENHHWTEDYATSKRTSLDCLARVCRMHHDMITYRGFELTGGPGRWKLLAPSEPAVSDSD